MRKGTPQLVLLGLLLVVVVLGAVLGSFGGRTTRRGSALSSEPGGRRAALLLLDELGFDAAPWTREPGHLEGGGLLLLYDVPPEPVGYPDPDVAEGDSERAARRLRDRRHYLRFVEDGGTLLVHADDDLVAFLAEELELHELAQLTEDASALRVSTAFLGSGEELRLSWRPLRALPETPELEVLLADDEGRALGVALRVDRGHVVLLSSEEDPFDNDSLDDGDHAFLLTRLAERFAGGRPVRFDDYALGLWTPTSALQLALAPRALLLTLHVLAFLGLLCWYGAWVRAFPRDPRPLEGVAPLERARGFAGLLARHRRFDLLQQALRRGFLRRLARRAGRRERDEAAETAAPLDAEEVDAVLNLVYRGPAEAGTRERARALLFGPRPTTPAALEALAEELAELEPTLPGSHESPSASSRRHHEHPHHHDHRPPPVARAGRGAGP